MTFVLKVDQWIKFHNRFDFFRDWAVILVMTPKQDMLDQNLFNLV